MRTSPLLLASFIAAGCSHSPRPETGAAPPGRPGASARLGAMADCQIDGESAMQAFACNVDFAEFVYTDGDVSHVFEQSANNPCVWVSTTLPEPTFHLTTAPIGEEGDMHVTFDATGDHCPVVLHGNRACSSARDSRCSDAQKNIAMAACEGFHTACDGG